MLNRCATQTTSGYFKTNGAIYGVGQQSPSATADLPPVPSVADLSASIVASGPTLADTQALLDGIPMPSVTATVDNTSGTIANRQTTPPVSFTAEPFNTNGVQGPWAIGATPSTTLGSGLYGIDLSNIATESTTATDNTSGEIVNPQSGQSGNITSGNGAQGVGTVVNQASVSTSATGTVVAPQLSSGQLGDQDISVNSDGVITTGQTGSRSYLYQNGTGIPISIQSLDGGSTQKNYGDGYSITDTQGNTTFTAANMSGLGVNLSGEDEGYIANRAQDLTWTDYAVCKKRYKNRHKK